MACVDVRNRFVWVNEAFEKLCGYSRAELEHMTWMEITVQADVGGDLASVNAVIAGDDDRYTIAKRYKHKLGREVPIALTVWRFPRSVGEAMACFIVEAVPEKASLAELESLRADLMRELDALRGRIVEHDTPEVNVSYNSQNADNGGSNSNNSTMVIVAMAAVIVVGFVALTTLFLGGALAIKTTPDGGGTVQVEGD